MRYSLWFEITIILTLGSVCLGQENLQVLDAAPKLGSTRTLSMGGVHIPTNGGIDALSGNPGGLPLINGAQLSVSGRVRLLGKSDFDEEFYEDFWQKRRSGFTRSYRLTNVGLVFPITIPTTSVKLVTAVGYRSFYDWQRKEFAEGEWESSVYNGLTTYERSYRTKGLMDLLSLGLGTTISEKWSFGMSINIPLRERYETEYEGETIYPDGGYDYYRRERWDVSAGNFLHFGGIFQITPKLTVGISCPFVHKFTIRNGMVTYRWSHDGQERSYEIDGKYKWRIPGTFDLGIAYQLRPDLLLAGEIQNRPWEEIRINGLQIDGVKSGNAYRVGLEYGDTILYRIGFALDRLPILDADDHGVDIKNATAGIGFQLKQWTLDAALVYKFVAFDNKLRWYSDHLYQIRELVIHSTLQYNF